MADDRQECATGRDQASTGAAAASDQGAGGERRESAAFRRLGRFAKEHPVVMLTGAAVVGAVTGIEWAAGAALGMVVGAVLDDKSGRRLRERLMERGRDVVAHARGVNARGAEETRPAPQP